MTNALAPGLGRVPVSRGSSRLIARAARARPLRRPHQSFTPLAAPARAELRRSAPLARPAHPVADPRRLAAKLGLIEQLLDVPHPVRPLPEPFPGHRRAGPGGSGGRVLGTPAPARAARLTSAGLPASLPASLSRLTA